MHARSGASRRRNARAAALLAAAIAAGISGCGGDDSRTTATAAPAPRTATSAPPPTTAAPSEADKRAAFKAAYSAERAPLNAVTLRLGTALDTADQKTNAQIAEEFGTLGRELGAGIDRLKRLDPPADLAADFGVVTRTADAMVGDLGDIASAARTGDPAAAKSATQALVGRVPTLSDATRRIVKALGLKLSVPTGTGTTTSSASR
jgi:hypothetical protein